MYATRKPSGDGSGRDPMFHWIWPIVRSCSSASVQNRFAPNGYPNDEPTNAPFRPNTTELPTGLSSVVRRTPRGLPATIGAAHAATGVEGVGGGGGVTCSHDMRTDP